MINNLIIQGHLTADPVYRPGQNGGKSSCWGKIGVYQGKDQNGNDLDSMFIEFTCFGSEADTLNQVAHKGDLIVACGRFTETKSIGNDGKEYINKKVVGNAKMCYKNPNQQPMTNPYAQPMQQAPVQQPMTNPYTQPVQYQQAPVQQTVTNPQQYQNQMNPWG